MTFTSNQPLLVNQLPLSIDFPKEWVKFLDIWTELYKRIANCVNTKEGGLFSLQEQFSSQQYFTLSEPGVFRNVYRKTFDMVELNGGSIAAGATVTFPHNITGILDTATIYGGATNSDAPVKYIPLPYVSATSVTNQVQIYLTPTDVVLINGATQSALTQAYIVAEYLKN